MASRAFLYELSLSRSNAGRDVRRNARSIRIVSLQMAGEKRIYRTTEPINQPEVPAEKAPEIYLLRGGKRRPSRLLPRPTSSWWESRWTRPGCVRLSRP